MSDQHEREDSRVSLYLCDVTGEEIDEICQEIADIAVKRGLADPEGIRALIAAEGFEWPDEAEEMIERVMSTAAVIVIPTPDAKAVDA